MNWMNLLMFTVNQITCRKFKELLHVYTGIWQKQIKLRSVWNITTQDRDPYLYVTCLLQYMERSLSNLVALIVQLVHQQLHSPGAKASNSCSQQCTQKLCTVEPGRLRIQHQNSGISIKKVSLYQFCWIFTNWK